MPKRPKRWEHTFHVPARDQDPEGRPCGCGKACVAATITRKDDGPAERTPATSYQAVCRACELAVSEALPKLPRMYAELEAELGEPVRRIDMVRVPFGPSIPLRADVDELMRRIVVVLTGWHDRVATLQGLTPPDPDEIRTKPVKAVTRAAVVLAAHLSPLIALPPGHMDRYRGDDSQLDGGDAVAEILRLHQRGQMVLGEIDPRPERLLGVRCYNCQQKLLVRADPPKTDIDPLHYSRCVRCGHVMTEPEYRDYLKRLIATERGRVTTPRLEHPSTTS